MSPDAARARLRLPRRRGRMRATLLRSALLACLVPLPAMAHDLGPPDRDLPRRDRESVCDDLCRAWMSWGLGPLVAFSRMEPMGGVARPARGTDAALPRPPAPPRARRTRRAGAPEPFEARRVLRDEIPSSSRAGPPSRRLVTPRRPTTLASTPIDAPPLAGARKPGRLAARAAPRRGRAVDGFRASEADAAILALPLYRPSDAAEAAGGRSGGDAPPRAPDPAAGRRGARDAAEALWTPAMRPSEPPAVPSAAPIPANYRPLPAPAAGTPPADGVAAARPPQGLAPAKAVRASALPASDLESLDEAQPRGRPVAFALPTAPAPPTAGALLLGGLAILSLLGLRSPRFASDPR